MQKVRKIVGAFHFYMTDFYFVINKYFAWKKYIYTKALPENGIDFKAQTFQSSS